MGPALPKYGGQKEERTFDAALNAGLPLAGVPADLADIIGLGTVSFSAKFARSGKLAFIISGLDVVEGWRDSVVEAVETEAGGAGWRPGGGREGVRGGGGKDAVASGVGRAGEGRGALAAAAAAA